MKLSLGAPQKEDEKMQDKSFCSPFPQPLSRMAAEGGLGDLGSQRICRDQSPGPLPGHCETQRHQSLDGGDVFPLGVRGGLVYFLKKGKEISAGIRYAILAALPWGNKLHIALYTNTAPNADPAGSTVPLLSLGK